MRHLLDLMEYIERHSLDTRLYWFLPEDPEAHSPALEVKYQQIEAKGWYYKFKNQEIWLYCERDDLVAQLRWHQVDLTPFVKQMEQSITQQIVYTRMIYREAAQLIGDERLDAAVAGHEVFLDELNEAIRGMLGSPINQEKPYLRLVHDETRILN